MAAQSPQIWRMPYSAGHLISCWTGFISHLTCNFVNKIRNWFYHNISDKLISVQTFPQVLMLTMISSQVSSHECSTSTSPEQMSSRQLDCNFFLTAIRLASLNQILDPWVYLLFREILLRKFFIVANAVTNCSSEDQRETQAALDALNNQNQDRNNL